MSGSDGAVLALSGGIGGAKLALGLSRVLPPERLIVVANTGDDFEHLGLAISPDLDTLMYTLAGVSDPERGWGRRDETWTFMAALTGRPSSAIIFAVGPFTARPPMIGDTATTGAAVAAIAVRSSGTARIGSMLR